MSFSYKDAGVDIDAADATKCSMAESLKTDDPRVLNTFGAFASVVDGVFPGYEHPVLVCKTEEPGSKQIIAFAYDRIESVCADMINHLLNDMLVMGAHPLFVQDCVVCGRIEPQRAKRIVKGIADACKAQGCVLTGGETSEQPGVVPVGTYILTASGIAIAEKAHIIDGSAIRQGHTVLALASSGLHTNGYTLVRKLMESKPEILKEKIDGRSFIDAILTPHFCYYNCIKDLFINSGIHGMAHITGGGVPGNLNRILPETLDAHVDCASIRIPSIFKVIHRYAENSDTDMIKTYNLGVGLTVVIDPACVDKAITHLATYGVSAYPIGTIVKGTGSVQMSGELKWST